MKDLMEFLDRYDKRYTVKGDRVVVDGDVRLYKSGIDELPESIGSLKCKILDLSNNQFMSLPESFGNLKCDYLYLNDNQLTSLPDSIGRLKCEELSLSNNPLEPCLHLFKEWDDEPYLWLKGTSMYKEGAKKVGDYRKEIDLAYELRKPDNTGIKSMFDMGLF